LVIATLLGLYYYLSIPTLEDTEGILKLERFVNAETFEGKTMFIILPKELEKDTEKAETLRASLCAAIKNKFQLRDFYCKFYTHELDEALKLSLDCNFLNICHGWVVEKVYTQNGRDVYKEHPIGRVVFRLD
jgi:hypothetical protein